VRKAYPSAYNANQIEFWAPSGIQKPENALANAYISLKRNKSYINGTGQLVLEIWQ
jgi:hypothetical protein